MLILRQLEEGESDFHKAKSLNMVTFQMVSSEDFSFFSFSSIRFVIFVLNCSYNWMDGFSY